MWNEKTTSSFTNIDMKIKYARELIELHLDQIQNYPIHATTNNSQRNLNLLNKKTYKNNWIFLLKNHNNN